MPKQRSKLEWITDPRGKNTISELHYCDYFTIEVRKVVHLNKIYMFSLNRSNEQFIGYFKKLSSAKKVAQLIHNG